MLVLVAECFGRILTFPMRDDATELTGGALPTNAIYLPFKGISRRHFVLKKEGRRWVLEDLGSRNGVTVNGNRVTRSPVRPGDEIQAGIIRMRLQSAAGDTQPIPIPQPPSQSVDDSGTDRVGHVPIAEDDRVFSFPDLVFPEGMITGKSAAMLDVCKKIHSIAHSDVSVLLVGETGTGKEMFARALHLSGRRSGGPFVALNCAAIPAELAEAELFGIGEKVATDVSRRPGKMTLAHEGTLFLDELSSFPVALQAKILRAIESREIFPVGESRPRVVDFRLVAATNQDPVELRETGQLREDLYHRIATVEIHIPPLRERKGDVELLIMHLIRKLTGSAGKTIPGISRRLFAALVEYSYPGNVREMINIVHSMVALAHPGEVLDLHLAPEHVLRKRAINQNVESRLVDLLPEERVDLHEIVNATTKRLVVQALTLHRGNITRAAGHLKVTVFGLRKMIQRFSLDIEEFKK